jgi:hypothetical protein
MNVKFGKMTSHTTQEGKLYGCISGMFIFQILAETPTILTRLRGVPHFLPASAGIVPQSWPGPLPSTSCPAHYLLSFRPGYTERIVNIILK